MSYQRAKQSIQELQSLIKSGQLDSLSGQELKGLTDDLYFIAHDLSLKAEAKGISPKQKPDTQRPIGFLSRLVEAWTNDTNVIFDDTMRNMRRRR